VSNGADKHGLAGHESQPGRPPGKKWTLALTGLIGTFVVLAGYSVSANLGQIGASHVTAAAKTSRPTAGGRTARPAEPRTTPPAPATPASTTASPASHPLGVASVVAFGPEGTADGDNPGIASRVLDVSTGLPWYTQWYATPDFGNLRPGTGLLLTLAAAATVRDVQLVLGDAPGTDVQVRVGNSPVADLPTMASSSDVAGTVRITVPATATGRYVLIWFTRLPPDGPGRYQVSVYSVTVEG
jgi:hypothetical protein